MKNPLLLLHPKAVGSMTSTVRSCPRRLCRRRLLRTCLLGIAIGFMMLSLTFTGERLYHHTTTSTSTTAGTQLPFHAPPPPPPLTIMEQLHLKQQQHQQQQASQMHKPFPQRQQKTISSSSAAAADATATSVAAIISSPTNSQKNSMHVNSTDNILLVHVGKTGGESVKNSLRIGCEVRMGRTVQRACWNAWDAWHGGNGNTTATAIPESKLSTLVKGYFHYHSMFPKRAPDRATAFLITVRNPVDRIVSWFRYVSPHNCHDDHANTVNNSSTNNGSGSGSDGGAIPKKISTTTLTCRNRLSVLTAPQTVEGSWIQTFFYDCFPTVQAMALHLQHLVPLSHPILKATNHIPSSQKSQSQSQPAQPNSTCTRLLKRAFVDGVGPEAVLGHLVANYSYYDNYTVHLYPEKTLYLLRTEHLWSDVHQLETVLHGHGSEQQQHLHAQFRHNVMIRHGSAKHFDSPDLTALAAWSLCCMLHNELAILYQEWLPRAVNLTPEQKYQTEHDALERCYVQSWDELLDQCGWKHKSRLKRSTLPRPGHSL